MDDSFCVPETGLKERIPAARALRGANPSWYEPLRRQPTAARALAATLQLPASRAATLETFCHGLLGRATAPRALRGLAEGIMGELQQQQQQLWNPEGADLAASGGRAHAEGAEHDSLAALRCGSRGGPGAPWRLVGELARRAGRSAAQPRVLPSLLLLSQEVRGARGTMRRIAALESLMTELLTHAAVAALVGGSGSDEGDAASAAGALA